MKSCIYQGQVRHTRKYPTKHDFSYGLFMMYLDLDELPNLFQKFWLWSVGKKNIAWFDRSKHTGDKSCSLITSIRRIVKEETGLSTTGPVRLLTHMTYFGYSFNPVSFYYCFDDDGETLLAIVAEVNNTPWNEQHCYVLPIDGSNKKHYKFEFEKNFHVSPFNSCDQQYDWRFIKPESDLVVFMNVIENDIQIFETMMNMKKREINSQSLALMLFRYPLMTVKIVFSIYYQAFKLFIKGTPLHTHPLKQTPNTETKEI